MPLLRDPRTINPVAVVDACTRLFPRSVAGEISGGDPGSFQLDGCTVHVSGMPVPIPGGEAERAAETSLLWPDATEHMQSATAHAIVYVDGAAKHSAACLVAQRAVSAVLDATDSLGVYVGDAGHLVRADMWIEQIHEDPDELFTPFWFDIRAGAGKSGGVDAFTRGLTPFGIPDLEVVESKQAPSAVWEFLGGIGAYLIDNGDVVKDGDTVGLAAEQKVKARLAPSSFGLDGTVLRLSF